MKFFDHDRGFGFISRDGGQDVFVHASNLQAGGTTLTEGQTVEFEVGPGRKSEEAKNVRGVNSVTEGSWRVHLAGCPSFEGHGSRRPSNCLLSR